MNAPLWVGRTPQINCCEMSRWEAGVSHSKRVQPRYSHAWLHTTNLWCYCPFLCPSLRMKWQHGALMSHSQNLKDLKPIAKIRKTHENNMFFLGNGGFQFQFSLEPIQWVQWHLQNHLPQLFDFLVGAAMRHVESSIRSSRSPACGAIRSHRAIVWCDLAKGTKGTGDMFWHWLYVLHYLLHLWYRNSYPNHQWYTFMDKNIPPGSVSMSNIYI